jgi:hypothetical protein
MEKSVLTPKKKAEKRCLKDLDRPLNLPFSTRTSGKDLPHTKSQFHRIDGLNPKNFFKSNKETTQIKDHPLYPGSIQVSFLISCFLLLQWYQILLLSTGL